MEVEELSKNWENGPENSSDIGHKMRMLCSSHITIKSVSVPGD